VSIARLSALQHERDRAREFTRLWALTGFLAGLAAAVALLAVHPGP
jgi:hypothetical protein